MAAPDLIIPDGTRKTRNVFQIIKDQPEIALQAIELRRNGLEIVRKIGGRPIHPTSSTPGGISTELDDETQKDLLQRAQRNVELAQATLDLAKPIFEEKIDLINSLGYFGDTRHCGLVNDGVWDVYNGDVRIKDVDGSIYTEYKNLEYKDVVAEHVKPYSWLKFPYIKELGYPEGIYRVAPLSRINVADKMPDAAPLAQAAFEEFERTAGEGAGIVEAARGTLIHNYACDDNGLVTEANIVVATIQNNPAMEMGIQQVAKDYIKPGVEVDDKIFNLMEMVIRAYDPCLSCATHTMDSQMRLAEVDIVDSEGNIIKKF